MVSRTAQLDLVVGSLITVREAENRKIFKQQQAIAEQIQAQLHGAGIDYDFLFEPGTVVWTGSIETLDALYHLQRLAVRLEHGRDVAQVLAEGPVLTDDLDSMVTNIMVISKSAIGGSCGFGIEGLRCRATKRVTKRPQIPEFCLIVLPTRTHQRSCPIRAIDVDD